MYRTKILQFSKMSCIEVHKYRTHRQFSGATGTSVLQRALRETPQRTLLKVTVPRGNTRIFRNDPPVLVRKGGAAAARVKKALKTYASTLPESSQQALKFYRATDVAFKIVGTGSVATHDYVVLHFAGDGTRDPLFLQVKEAVQSAYAPYVRTPEKSIHQGQRVVDGQRLFEIQSDMMLGWTSLGGADYLVRQLSDHKASIRDDELRGTGLLEYATTCGEVLAKGHARSGDPAVLAGYLGASDRWDNALAKFARAYADQTTSDYELFKKAIKAGRIKASKSFV
jgi:uncharacterized protein (DUF2252 family)